jgi:hypothetical protein
MRLDGKASNSWRDEYYAGKEIADFKSGHFYGLTRETDIA